MSSDNKGGFGGRSGTAKAGGYNQGCQYAAEGNFRGGVGQHKDLRGGDATSGGYNQGPEIAGTTGGAKPGSHKDLRGGTATSGGYNQGDQK